MEKVMFTAPGVVFCAVLTVAACGDSTGSMCERLLRCANATEHPDVAMMRASYGSGGSCWDSADTRGECLTECRVEMARMRGETPLEAACFECQSDSDCEGFPTGMPYCHAGVCSPWQTLPEATPFGQFSDLDILFVIGGSSFDAQESLSLNFGYFVEALAAGGQLPNVHLGFVNMDVGGGPASTCPLDGDNGVLQSTPRLEGCSPPTDRYVRDVEDGAGGRSVNYEGSLADTFACIVGGISDSICLILQPLEAMKRALSNTDENSGFLRPEAALAVVFVTNADDCSLFSDSRLFDRDDASLGPLSLRCFEHGIVCDPDEPRTEGEKHFCTSREDSSHMPSVQSYADFLVELKGDASKVFVATIAGNRGPVVVGPNSLDEPKLDWNCFAAATDETIPAIRLHAFAERLPHRLHADICSGADLSGALEAVGSALRGN